ncbi:MAG: hypothetical protein SGBAC_009112 [Bacillariaceae sp.]
MPLGTIHETRSFDSTTSSTYTPQKKKQKTKASRPPLAPTKPSKIKRRAYIPDAWPSLESRCEQEAAGFIPTQGREENDGHEGRDTEQTKQKVYHLTPTHWKSPPPSLYSLSGNKRLMEDNDQHHPNTIPLEDYNDDVDEMGRTLDGLELLEMMSFDEGDCYQGDNEDDDVSLSYSIASEGY